MKKKDIIQFFVWLRNGISFCVTWFLILIIIMCKIVGTEMIGVNLLTKLLVFVSGGVLIFCSFFTKIFIKKWLFTARLTGFIISITMYECLCFYWIGLFRGSGNIVQWIIFVSIIFVLYFICIIIYCIYSKKQGEIYTQALHQYQQGRIGKSGKS